MKDYNSEHELLRRKVWIDSWVGTANANDCKSPETATKYADNALKAFDDRFKRITDNSMNSKDKSE